LSHLGFTSQQLFTEFGELTNLDLLDTLFEAECSLVPAHVVSAFRL
jgi:hypothetical protein